MKKKEIMEICDERFDRWKRRLASQYATPIILIGVGHDHNSGQLSICTVEEMDNSMIRIIFTKALELL